MRVEERYPVGEEKGKRETKTRQFIKASLYPDDNDRRAPSYSMFGTNRYVSRFDLIIEEIADDKEERCWTYGTVSYTTEIDFRDVTDDDSVAIYFYVHSDTFRHYAERVVSNEVDSLTVRVGGADGFYSEWSPGITTDKIKILTSDKSHEVKSSRDVELPLPRLGEVLEAELYFNHDVKFASPEPEDEELAEDELDDEERPVDRAFQLEAARDHRSQETVKLLTSLHMAAWIIAALLFVRLFL